MRTLEFIEERIVYLAHLYELGADDPVWLDEQLSKCQDELGGQDD